MSSFSLFIICEVFLTVIGCYTVEMEQRLLQSENNQVHVKSG